VGPKWTSQLSTRWSSESNSLREVRLTLKRDLHDALLLMMIGARRNIYKDDNNGGNGLSQLDFRVGLSPKLPHQELPEGVPGIQTLEDRAKTPDIDTVSEDPLTFQRY
jgi:hypothetical protein